MLSLSQSWQWGCVVFALASSAQVITSNETTKISSYDGVLQLQSPNGQNISELVPLTRDAIIRNNAPLKGNLFHTTADTVTKLSTEDISYISCNPADYSEGGSPFGLLQSAMQHNLTAVILYSTASDYCGYQSPPEPLQEFPILSMTDRQHSSDLLNSITNPSVAEKYFVTVTRLGSDRGDQRDNRPPQNPLGPSPSTAVAMIILYSITGIITALFLVIIITGAVRAHRHPDRYGPRDVLGRPRQSRARGLGRAILDTIPIVKFGERDNQPKPADVELGSTSEARPDGDATPGVAAQPGQAETETKQVSQDEASRDVVTEQQSGISPAQPLPAVATAPENSTTDEHLGCSICTEDFEKGQDIRVLPCDHKFHPECVDPWLLNVSGTCPLCRVDLRPPNSADSNADEEQDPDSLAPPLQPETDPSHRRRSALRDILGFRTRPNASPEERISALRRLREQRRNQSGDGTSSSENGSTEDVVATRRSRRISARLSDVFSSRTRRHGHDEPPTPVTPTTPGPGPRSNNEDVEPASNLQR